MATITKNRNSERDKVLKELSSFTSFLSHELHTSKMLNDADLSNELLTIIDDAIKRPIETTFEAYQHVNNTLKNLLKESVIGFFKNHNSIVDKAYLNPDDDSDLHFSIILKKESSANRAKLIEFLDAYRKSPISSKVPMWFQFVPKSLNNYLEKEGVLLVG